MTASRFGIIAHTHVGMPAVVRPPAMTRDRLLRFAESGARIFAAEGAPRTAAVCEAYLASVAENDHLRRQLATLRGWGDEPTRRESTPDLAKCATRTGMIEVPR